MIEYSLLTKPGDKQHGNCHFHRPAGAAVGLLEGRGIASPEFPSMPKGSVMPLKFICKKGKANL